jgi:nitrogen regulatory protein P-II 1
MKKIEAIIREERLEPVKQALEKIGCYGLTVTKVVGRGRQGGLVLQSRIGEYRVDLLPKVKIEMVVLDDDLGRMLDAVLVNARTGEIGDGKVFVFDVADVVRVRTGDTGVDAI